MSHNVPYTCRFIDTVQELITDLVKQSTAADVTLSD